MERGKGAAFFNWFWSAIINQKRLGKDETEWVVAAFPLGGYVKMLDEHEDQVEPQDLKPEHSTASRLAPVCHCCGRSNRQFSAGDTALLVAIHARRQRYEANVWDR